jgi:phosphatidylglycerol:prolipoprotein diacylglycerol transferase
LSRVAFEVLGFPVYWYGLLFAGGFLAGILHWGWLARRAGLPPTLGSDLAVVIMAGTLVGARGAYVLSNLPYFLEHPARILAFREGGMVFYGGLVLSLALLIGFAVRRRLHPLDVLDFTATAVPLGHAFGRLGCFLNGCCQGAPSAWGVLDFEGVRRVPVQLFEAGGNLLIFAALTFAFLRRPARGAVLALYFLLYPALRFGLEFWRGDERLLVAAGLNAAQFTSLGLMAVSAFLLFRIRRGRTEA